MQRIKSLSLLAANIAGFSLYYAAMRLILSADEMLVLMNGLFAGAITAVIVAYGPLIYYALIGRHPYDRVWQMTLGFAVLWAAICLNVLHSIILQTSEVGYPIGHLELASRFTAVIAACLQVSAPDFGLGIFHGKDRKVLWTAVSFGALAAAIVILIQRPFNV